jgi:hypothetical protein
VGGETAAAQTYPTQYSSIRFFKLLYLAQKSKNTVRSVGNEFEGRGYKGRWVISCFSAVTRKTLRL